MTVSSRKLLEDALRLPAGELREVGEALLREIAARDLARLPTGRSVAEVAGKYRPLASRDAEDHDAGFAEAILASKDSREGR